jgi:RHS repeat-associated protein
MDPGNGGLILCGARWYSPTLARWLSRDPSGYDGGPNLYEYCGEDPVNWADPSGLAPVGHHYVTGPIRTAKGLSKEARLVFDKCTTGPFPDHVFDAAHRAYSASVEGLWSRYLKQTGIQVDKMTGSEADRFVNLIRSSNNPAIRNFLQDAEERASKYFLRQLAQKAAARKCAEAGAEATSRIGLKIGLESMGRFAGPVVLGAFFLYDWHQVGFKQAVKNQFMIDEITAALRWYRDNPKAIDYMLYHVN